MAAKYASEVIIAAFSLPDNLLGYLFRCTNGHGGVPGSLTKFYHETTYAVHASLPYTFMILPVFNYGTIYLERFLKVRASNNLKDCKL